MDRFRVPAYVLGGGTNGLGVVRNLGRHGVLVYCVVERHEQVEYSKFCRKCYIVPNIEKSGAILRKFLHDVGRRAGGGVLFPTSDLFSLNLSELKEEVEDDYHVPLPSYEVVKKLVDKKEFYQSLSEFGVPYPITQFPESLEDARRISKEIGYPVFVKPIRSQEFQLRFKKKGFFANTASELIRYYAFATESDCKVMFQQVIPGLAAKNVYGIEGYFDQASEFKAIFAHIRLRGWPPIFGNTCLRESIPVSDISAQVEVTRNYLRHLSYHGLMEAEWKRDPRDGSFKLLEINPRQSMQNALPSRCGINLILIAYLDAIDEKIKDSYGYEKGIKWANFLQDLASAMETRMTFREYVSSLRNIREWSYLASDDVSPWLISNLETAKEVVARIRTGTLT